MGRDECAIVDRSRGGTWVPTRVERAPRRVPRFPPPRIISRYSGSAPGVRYYGSRARTTWALPRVLSVLVRAEYHCARHET